MPYISDDPSDGLTEYTPPPAGGAYTNPGGVVQLSSAPGAAMASSSGASTTYVPGQVYMPPPNVSVSALSPVESTQRYPVYENGEIFIHYGKPQYTLNPHGVNALSAGRNQAPVRQTQSRAYGISTIQEVKEDIFSGSESDLRELQAQFGIKETGLPDAVTVDAVNSFLDYVSEINSYGVQKTWREVLNELTDGGKKTLAESEGYTGAGAEEPFSGTKSFTSSNVQTLSPSETRSAAEQTFAAVLGRAPSRKERIALRATLNDMARENPVVTKTTTKYDEGEAVSSHSVTDGGVDIGQKILNEARSKEGYAEYQAINYFNTLESMLAAPGGA